MAVSQFQGPGRHVLALGLLLVLSSLCCAGLIGLRIWKTGSLLYGFLLWNLALAWVPMLAATLLGWCACRRISAPVTQSLLCLIWFLFFPNAPYILTDLLHLQPRAGISIWYDLMVFLFAAWSGLALAFGSLGLMHRLAQIRLGPAYGWLLVVLAMPAAGFGIYVGRFLRWNSWDLLVTPGAVLQTVLDHWSSPSFQAMPFLLVLLFILIYMTVYVAIHTGKPETQRQTVSGWHLAPAHAGTAATPHPEPSRPGTGRGAGL